jgi:hypothetical protein
VGVGWRCAGVSFVAGDVLYWHGRRERDGGGSGGGVSNGRSRVMPMGTELNWASHGNKAARVPRAIWPICHERRIARPKGAAIHLCRFRVQLAISRHPDTFVCLYILFLYTTPFYLKYKCHKRTNRWFARWLYCVSKKYVTSLI